MRELLIRVAAIVVLWVVADLLLPQGGFRRYAQLLAGLLLMQALIAPVLTLLSGMDSVNALLRAQARTEAVAAYSVDFDEYRVSALDRYRALIVERAEREARAYGLPEPHAQADIADNGDIRFIRVWNGDAVVASAQPPTPLAIRIAQLFDLSPDAVSAPGEVGP